MSLRKRNYGYLAAAIDGDGGIYICKSKVNGCDSYQAQLCVANSDIRLMKWLKHHYGGCLYKNSEKGSSPNFGSVVKAKYFNRDDNWQWRLTGNKAVGFLLDKIEPYLLINKQKYEPVRKLTFLHGQYCASTEREACFVQYSGVTDLFNPFTPHTYGYLAGLFDMEGSISIVPAAHAENYRVLFRIANNNKALLDWIKDGYGGKVYTSKKEQLGSKRHTWYRKDTDEKWVENFLLALLPYLIVKREGAQLALNMIRMPKHLRTLEWCESLRQKVIELNHSFSSVETNTPACPENGQKIEPQLIGDYESVSLVTATT